MCYLCCCEIYFEVSLNVSVTELFCDRCTMLLKRVVGVTLISLILPALGRITCQSSTSRIFLTYLLSKFSASYLMDCQFKRVRSIVIFQKSKAEFYHVCKLYLCVVFIFNSNTEKKGVNDPHRIFITRE